MTDLDFVTIGKRIKERRHALNITQEQIANVLDVNPSHISNIECGRSNPSLTVLVKIANVLECSIDTFISGEYTFDPKENKSFDTVVMEKLSMYDEEKKEKLLKMMDIL